MSERRRIRAQASRLDTDAMAFTLDTPVQSGCAGARPDMGSSAPLPRALYAIDGVQRVEVAGATIWVSKGANADWAALKPAIARAIRSVLDATDQPLGESVAPDPDTALLDAVQAMLRDQVNPSVAAHGGHIAAERVAGGIVYLRMSGGCQGCAASSATLRDGVERMLRAALPQIRRIVDMTDHDAGANPFYARDDGPSPLFSRALPPDVIGWQDGQVVVDPEYLAPRLGLTPDTLRAGLRNGDVVGVTETGEGADAGKARVVLRSPSRAWAAEIDADGGAREVPPPRESIEAGASERDLAARLRAHLDALPPEHGGLGYGVLAQDLGVAGPGAIRKITRALERTMQEDAAAGRPFIAARAISRTGGGVPGKGFFELARSLSRGPAQGESEAAFHAAELRRLAQENGAPAREEREA
ncbi:MAG: NifU family protein [Rhodobacteraceae bacterium]|nr:NifU family protein [Paracoccaceae bacterium]